MEIKCGSKTVSGTNATVVMESQDHLSVAYIDPRGKSYVVNINAQHLVLMVSEEGTEAAMLFRPAAGVQFVQPK